MEIHKINNNDFRKMCVQIFASDIRIYQNASFNYYDTHPIALFAILKNLAIISGLTVD